MILTHSMFVIWLQQVWGWLTGTNNVIKSGRQLTSQGTSHLKPKTVKVMRHDRAYGIHRRGTTRSNLNTSQEPPTFPVMKFLECACVQNTVICVPTGRKFTNSDKMCNALDLKITPGKATTWTFCQERPRTYLTICDRHFDEYEFVLSAQKSFYAQTKFQMEAGKAAFLLLRVIRYRAGHFTNFQAKMFAKWFVSGLVPLANQASQIPILDIFKLINQLPEQADMQMIADLYNKHLEHAIYKFALNGSIFMSNNGPVIIQGAKYSPQWDLFPVLQQIATLGLIPNFSELLCIREYQREINRYSDYPDSIL